MPTRERVHLIIARWMRKVQFEKGWSAGEWASLAGLPHTAITRVVSPPEGEPPMIPNVYTIAQLAAVAGTQPDLLRGGRRPVSYVPAERRGGTLTLKRRKAG